MFYIYLLFSIINILEKNRSIINKKVSNINSDYKQKIYFLKIYFNSKFLIVKSNYFELLFLTKLKKILNL